MNLDAFSVGDAHPLHGLVAKHLRLCDSVPA